jgi:hypothetical protein
MRPGEVRAKLGEYGYDLEALQVFVEAQSPYKSLLGHYKSWPLLDDLLRSFMEHAGAPTRSKVSAEMQRFEAAERACQEAAAQQTQSLAQIEQAVSSVRADVVQRQIRAVGLKASGSFDESEHTKALEASLSWLQTRHLLALRTAGAAAVASFLAAVLTDIYLCNVCSWQKKKLYINIHI